MFKLTNETEAIVNQMRALEQENAQLKAKIIPQFHPMESTSNDEIMKPFITYLNPMASTVNVANSIPSIPPIAYSGLQILDLYNIPRIEPTDNTRKVIVAIVIAFHYDNLLKDLTTYWKNATNFGPSSTPPSVIVHNLKSKSSVKSAASKISAWNQEECLDVQMICTVAPNANIHVVESNSDSAVDLNAAVQFALGPNVNADVISMSWGGNDTTFNSLFNSGFTSARNVCFCASSGDSNAACWPSVLSNCMAIGGSTLIWTPTVNAPSTKTTRTEYTWPKAGCGYSSTVLTPAYQSIINSNKNRATPDVSLIANPQTGVYVVYAGNWYSFGGTSVSAPIFAGILAQANQQRLNDGNPLLTTIYNAGGVNTYNVQNRIYSAVNTETYSQIFNDITIGRNIGSTSTNGSAVYSAGAKYDLATGLGTPNGIAFINWLSTM